jgi:iron complex outermembrane recepter protein
MARALKHAAGLLALACATVQGQGPAPAEAGGDAVVVTGEKVRRELQNTLSSVGVVTGGQVEDLGVPDMRSSFQLLPNVNSSPSNNGNNGITIRGINSEGLGAPGANLRPLASVVIDGATQSFEGVRRGARGLWDMEQVEVFRGPQSTLQGRNALAGAVLMRSRDPTYYLEGAARASAGQYELLDGAFMLSGPIVENQLAVRISGESASDQHDITYTDPRLQGLDDGRYRALRVKLLFEPKALPGLALRYTFLDAYDRPAVTAVSGPNYFERVLRQAAPGVETRENEVTNNTLEAEYLLAPGLRLVSVSSWIDTRVQFDTPTPQYVRDEQRDDDDFTQDLRLNFERGAFSGVAGLFYGSFGNRRDSVVRLQLVPGGPVGTLQSLQSSSSIRNTAAYGEVRWRLAEPWTLIAGLRYDQEDFAATFNDRIAASTTVTRTKYDAWLPKFGVSYDFTPTQTAGFTVARGYRAGFVEDDGRAVQPEYLTSYELAWRSRWLDGRLTANANVFYYDWRDQQVTVADPANPFGTITVNAGKSHAYGAEVQVSGRPLEGLQLGATLGLLRTELDEFVTAAGDYSGNEFPEAPRTTASAFGIYRHGNGLFVAGDWSFKSGFYATSDLANQPNLRIAGYGLVNLRAGYEALHWSVVGFVYNLFDRDYLTGRDLLLGAYVGDPRIVGVQFNARF